MGPPRKSLAERLERYQVKRGPDECWDWSGSMNNGYGQLMMAPEAMPGVPDKRPVQAHRVAYLLAFGVPPEGTTIDHLCHNGSGCPGGVDCLHRRCTNPAHLEAVTLAENKRRGNSPNAVNARKTHCKRGHEFTPENTIVLSKTGHRECRACHNAAERRYYAARKAAGTREGDE